MKRGRAGPLELQHGDLDALLVNLALARDFTEDKPLTYRVVDDGRVKTLSYVMVTNDRIEIEGKSWHAARLVSTENDKQTIVWLADRMPVPVRVLRRENGDTSDLRMRQVDGTSFINQLEQP